MSDDDVVAYAAEAIGDILTADAGDLASPRSGALRGTTTGVP